MPIGANERIFALLSDFQCKWLRIFSKWTEKGVIRTYFCVVYGFVGKADLSKG